MSLFSKLQGKKIWNCKFLYLNRNFRINIEVNQDEDYSIKSSKPETSEDSLNKNKSSRKNSSKADNINQTMDEDCKFFFIFISSLLYR